MNIRLERRRRVREGSGRERGINNVFWEFLGFGLLRWSKEGTDGDTGYVARAVNQKSLPNATYAQIEKKKIVRHLQAVANYNATRFGSVEKSTPLVK